MAFTYRTYMSSESDLTKTWSGLKMDLLSPNFLQNNPLFVSASYKL